MAKPPITPPSSDIAGVHRDGMRPSKPLGDADDGGEQLQQAAREDAARPDPSDARSADDRSR